MVAVFVGGSLGCKLKKIALLFEGVACYERHPWDVRVKVGSERKFATSDKDAKTRQNPVSTRSFVNDSDDFRGDPQILVFR